MRSTTPDGPLGNQDPEEEEMYHNQSTVVLYRNLTTKQAHKSLKRTHLRPSQTSKKKERKGEYQKEVMSLAPISLAPGASDYWGQAPRTKYSRPCSDFSLEVACGQHPFLLCGTLRRMGVSSALEGCTSLS